MTTRISADIHFKPADIRHRYHHADDNCHAYGLLKIDSGETTGANLYFDDAAHIDAMIAELVALRNEMEPPVIPPAERDCPALNPEGDWPCHNSGQHDEHEDDNGSTWTTAPERAVCGIRHNAAGHALCTREPGHAGGHKNTRTGDYWPAAVAS